MYKQSSKHLDHLLEAKHKFVFVEFTLRAVFHIFIVTLRQVRLGTKRVPLLCKEFKTVKVSVVILGKDIELAVSYEQYCWKTVNSEEIANVSLIRVSAIDLCNSNLLLTS